MYAKNRFSHTWGNSAPCNVRPSTPTYPFDHDSEELIKVTDRLSQMNAEYQRYITKYIGGDCAAVVRREDLFKKQ